MFLFRALSRDIFGNWIAPQRHNPKIRISNYRELLGNFSVTFQWLIEYFHKNPRKLFRHWHPRRFQSNFQIGYYNDINHFCMEVRLNLQRIPKLTEHLALLSAMVLSMIPTGPFYQLFYCLNTLNMYQMVFPYGLLLLFLLGVCDWLTITFAL